MARNEIALPPDVRPVLPFRPGIDRAVAQAVGSLGSGFTGTDWDERNRKTYTYTPATFDAAGTLRAQWEAMLHDCGNGASGVWVPEVASQAHRHVLCGPIGDGTRTTFPISVKSPSSVTVFTKAATATEPSLVTTVTAYAAANVLTADQWSAVDSIDELAEVGSCSIAQGSLCAAGLTGVAVTPAGSAAQVGTRLATANVVATSPGAVWTGVASLLGVGDFVVRLRWMNSSKVLISEDDTAVTGALSWQTASVTATAPALTAYVDVRVVRSTNSANVFYVSNQALCYGDYDRSHDPRNCPGLLVFYANIPAAGTRVEAHATGVRISRCQMVAARRQFTEWGIGHTSVGAVEFIEQAESTWT